MTAKKVVLRRAAGAALALVLALAVAGPVAAGKKPPPTTGDKTPPTTPTDLRVTDLGQEHVTLAWNPSTDNSASVTYVVYKDGQGFTVPQGQTSYTIDWLSPGRTYNFWVRAFDKSLNGSAPSNTVTVTTHPDTVPPTAPVLTGFVLGPSQVRLEWTRSTDDITWWSLGYRVFVNGAPATAHVNWWGERIVVLRHLTPGTTYTFGVEANDFNGNTTMSNTVTLATEPSSDVTPPSVPTNVRILENNGGCEFWVGWTQSTDETDPQFAIEYEIYVNGVLSPLAVGAGIDRDFVYGTDSVNVFTVKAVDRAGNTSAASNSVTDFC